MTGTQVATSVATRCHHLGYEVVAIAPNPPRSGYMPTATVAVRVNDNPVTPYVVWTAFLDDDGKCVMHRGAYFDNEHDAKECVMERFMKGAA